MKASLINKIALALASVSIMAFTTACSRSSGNTDGTTGSIYNPTGDPGYGYGSGSQGCGNCGSAKQFVTTALGQGDSPYAQHLQLGLDIFMDPYYLNTPDGTLMYAFQNYPAGAPIGGSGELEVRSDFSSCQVPPGVYRVFTLQPGQYVGYNQFKNLVLQGQSRNSGATITIALNSTSNNYITYLTAPSISYNGLQYNYKLQKTMTILAINGYQCSGGTYELY